MDPAGSTLPRIHLTQVRLPVEEGLVAVRTSESASARTTGDGARRVSPLAAYPRMRRLFEVAIVAQGLHCLEHVAQVYQHLVFHQSDPQGFLGRWFNREWIHFGFNVLLGVALLVLFVGCRMDEPAWRRYSPLGWGAFVGALLIEDGLHVPEHVARLSQYLRYGWNPAPGILGHTAFHGTGPFNLFVLHTVYNFVVTGLIVAAYLAFRPRRRRVVKRRTLLVVLAAVIVLPLLAVAVGTWFGSNPRRPKASASFMALPFSGSTPQCLPTPGAALSLTAGGTLYHSANNLGPVACLAFEPGQPTTLTFRNLEAASTTTSTSCAARGCTASTLRRCSWAASSTDLERSFIGSRRCRRASRRSTATSIRTR